MARKSIAVALLVFHLLAAGRALVPGMCQTLEAVKDGRPSCCASACPMPKTESPGVHLDTLAPEHPPCPFCHLVCTAAHAAPLPLTAHADREAVATLGLRYGNPDTADLSSPQSVRAPPALIPA